MRWHMSAPAPRAPELTGDIRAVGNQACRYAPAWHFFMKLVFAAPASFLPSPPTALASQASFLHFFMKLVFAAPTRALPSLPTALLSQVSCAMAEPNAKIVSTAARKSRFIIASVELSLRERRREHPT